MKLSKLVNNRCCKCGSQSLTLAEDSTTYSPCEYDEASGKWNALYRDTEPSSADDAVRFFCADCGEQHEVPKGLP